DGYIGNFKVTIRKKARYVDIKKCTGCGNCWNSCPNKRFRTPSITTSAIEPAFISRSRRRSPPARSSTRSTA
ncbi:MAG: 4Fe-4S binding protein, partial [Thermoguttaceae bacterium]|nr:4Fe-4S binding protein [Thermoguttaceae bacterium]